MNFTHDGLVRYRVFLMKTIALTLALGTLLSSPFALAETEEKKPVEENVVWNDDPLCQFIFFAVLEGLYRDGVQNEVVDLVLGEGAEKQKKGEEIKRCFVFKCELCHATYEAFRTYRSRPVFANSAGQSTFGKGVKAELIESLKSDEAGQRVFAMGKLVRPWIQQRVKSHRLTKEEQTKMQAALFVYIKEGSDLLDKLKREPGSAYIDWNFYGSCQACEAAKDFE